MESSIILKKYEPTKESLETHCKRVQGQLDIRKIPIRFALVNKPKDLAEIIYRLICNMETTYYNNGKVQCYSGKCRSTQDLYSVVRYYIPDISYNVLYNILHELLDRKLSNHYCHVVRKVVFYKRILKFTLKDLRDILEYKNKLVKI